MTIDRDSARAAAEWILERRTACDDPDVGRFPDVADLLGVVEFVERYQRVPPEVLRDDAVGVLAILNFLAGELDRRKLLAIRIGRRSGTTWRMLAGPLGVRTYQAAEQVALRLEDLFGGANGTRREDAGREIRRRRARQPRPAGPSAGKLAELRAALGQLLTNRDDLPDDLAESVTLLRREASKRFAEMSGTELIGELRVIAGEMVGTQWPPAVQAALDRLRAALG